jgi:hypothetical protein
MRLSHCFAATLIAFSSIGAFAADWKSSGETDGVQLYSKSEPGESLKYFKGVTRIKAPMKNVLAVILVRETFPEWVYNMLEDSTLPSDNPDSSYCYIWIKGVWPTDDRDTVARVTVSQDPQTLAVAITAKSTEQHRVPVKKDRVRIQNLYSGFTVRPISAEETEVQLEGVADPAGNIPAFVTNIVASDLPAKTLVNLRTRLETPGKVDLSVLDKVPFAQLSMQKIKLPQ